MVNFFLTLCYASLFCYLFLLWKQWGKRRSRSYYPLTEDEIEIHGTHSTNAEQKEDIKTEIHGSLPREIIMDILTRLPVKSLMRFSVVSRGFNTLFQSHSFIAEHLKFSGQSPSLLLPGINKGSHRTGVTPWFTLHLLSSPSPTETTRLVEKPFPIADIKIQVEGSSNGLLCLTVRTLRSLVTSILIWNPATRQVKRLPKPSCDVTKFTRFSFGFAPVVNDHKVVLVQREITTGVEVYSLKNGAWTHVEVHSLTTLASGLQVYDEPICSYSIEKLVTTNGSSYGKVLEIIEKYEAYKHLDHVKRNRRSWIWRYLHWILCFDLGTETFTRINRPELPPYDWNDVAPYGDSIALLVKSKQPDYTVNLWVYDKGGDCWANLYAVTPFSEDRPQYALSVWRDEVVITTRDSNEKVLVFTSNGVENKILVSHGAHSAFDFLKAYDYVESMVLI